MATSLTVNGTLLLRGKLTNTVGTGAVETINEVVVRPSLTNSVADLEYSLDDQALSSGTYTINLDGGSLTDSQGNTITFDKIHALSVTNGGDNYMTFTVADVNTGNDDMVLICPPGCSVFWYAPTGCAAGIGDITVAGTGSETFDATIFGSSA